MAHGAYLYEIPGLTPYQDAMTIQQDLAGARSQGAVPDVVMVLEHEPVISLGSRAVAAEELGTPVSVEDVRPTVVEAFAAVFDVEFEPLPVAV